MSLVWQVYSEVGHSSHFHEHHSSHVQSHGPPIHNRTFAGTTEGCGYWTSYFTTPNIKFNMCTGQTQQDLKNGMSIINLINARGFLPTCRVMHLMLWMMSEATPHHYIHRDNYFIDVGANIGSCSVHMASLGLPVISGTIVIVLFVCLACSSILVSVIYTFIVEPVIQHVQTIQGSADINPAFRIDVQHIGMASAQRTIKANFGHGARNWGATEFHEVGENQTFEAELKLKTLDQGNEIYTIV